MEIDGLPVFFRQGRHRVQYLGFGDLRGGGLRHRVQRGGSAPVGPQLVLAGVHRRPDDPRLFVFGALEAPGLGEQLEKDALADVLGVGGGLEVGEGEP